MKLIIREYLSSLKERGELDALLPDLLSQMGLDVFSKPGVGGRQYGIDVAAVGSIDGAPETVYLFSVKSGNLGRTDWNNTEQALRPSLDEIQDVYIQTHLPPEHRDKPIEICLCFGGNIRETVRLEVSSYIKRHTKDNLRFSEWDGERLANLIERYFLREELLPENCRKLLRKSLAILDEPAASHEFFKELVHLVLDVDRSNPEKVLMASRQLYICLWILYSWCREQGNIESAYLSSEFAVLQGWDATKAHTQGTIKICRAVTATYGAIRSLQFQVSLQYITSVVMPRTQNLHALSAAIKGSTAIDVNLKLFDILGRLAIAGLQLCWLFGGYSQEQRETEVGQNAAQQIVLFQQVMANMIENNPELTSPVKDDHAIDIVLAFWFMGMDFGVNYNLGEWLGQIVNSSMFRLAIKSSYPCNLSEYHELIHHPRADSGYFEEVTAGSILYPSLAVLCALTAADESYNNIRGLKSEVLQHCNFQIWFPDAASEDNFLSGKEAHGTTLSHVKIPSDKFEYLRSIFDESDLSSSFYRLSAIERSQFPLLLIACRYYRYPIPIHFFKTSYENFLSSTGGGSN
ncbi:hypothetical protein HU732_20435 [Pseudomonas proteolytica]|uniref:hypothetical protein n=1 Tax=Pseudomonas proteolytica TaxID=219574 RepID=UPI0016452694|nr:hypothetical protein [Pseudomonas proteolytica]